MRPIAWLPLLILLAACGSSRPEGRALGGPPPGFEAFPAQVLADDVFVEARYDSTHSSRFGTRLMKKGIFPIELNARLAGETDRQVMLSSERLDLRLILQDGTVLPALSPEEVIDRTSRTYADRIRRYAFRPSLLTTESGPGFVFFDLGAAGKYELEGMRMSVGRDGLVSRNDLERSLIVFTAVVDQKPRPFHVGIQR